MWRVSNTYQSIVLKTLILEYASGVLRIYEYIIKYTWNSLQLFVHCALPSSVLLCCRLSTLLYIHIFYNILAYHYIFQQRSSSVHCRAFIYYSRPLFLLSSFHFILQNLQLLFLSSTLFPPISQSQTTYLQALQFNKKKERREEIF